MHQSVATIKSPEFINLQPLDINPLMSSCEVKVLYTGQNRNGSYITKEVATEMAKTLRGAPIVGYYKADAEDFGDHGDQIVIDGEGFHFNCLTRPYGFVSPDAKVWFQEFDDTDDFGNITTREYLMTTGFLWTGQFEEARRVVEKGNNQSMELDDKTLDGHWSTDSLKGIEFFIIDDAIFSKLCLLGEDVEPCFEGASVTAPEISTAFSKDENDFKATLYNMMKDLKYALERRSDTMDNETKVEVQDTTTEFGATTETVTEVTETVETPVEETEFKKTEDDEKKEAPADEKKEDSSSDSDSTDDKKEDSSDDKEDDEKKKDFSAKAPEVDAPAVDYEKEYNTLKSEYALVVEELKELRSFKAQIESAQKDELIGKFYMLSDEDKADVIENKEKYSLDEIEAKLSVICFRKKVNFDLETNDKNESNTEDDVEITTYNLSDDECLMPAWVKEALARQNKTE